jgi:hypothetical protein
MRRRQFSKYLLTCGVCVLVRQGLAATNQAATESVKGKLVQHQDGPAVLQTDGGKNVTLAGDEGTQKVLHDPRLAGVTLEALGHFTAPDQFAVEPIFEKNMFVLKDGKRLRITYWCDICSIRTFAPGVCVCCQKWTDLDLRDPNQE